MMAIAALIVFGAFSGFFAKIRLIHPFKKAPARGAAAINHRFDDSMMRVSA
jgi:hypothetical protein